MRSGCREMGILGSLMLGGLAGWLVGLLMKGRGFGFVANIVVGMIGSFFGGCLLGLVKGDIMMD